MFLLGRWNVFFICLKTCFMLKEKVKLQVLSHDLNTNIIIIVKNINITVTPKTPNNNILCCLYYSMMINQYINKKF